SRATTQFYSYAHSLFPYPTLFRSGPGPAPRPAPRAPRPAAGARPRRRKPPYRHSCNRNPLKENPE
ncbi:hypothetical protein, partial [Streptomyces sp. NPDC052701]|uniref:hypothetical protein n=1 Tax=Streptomyces sp. NPDC052701 TaxID=3155533 RepID=UPI00343F4201